MDAKLYTRYNSKLGHLLLFANKAFIPIYITNNLNGHIIIPSPGNFQGNNPLACI